jgi:hypothetical protein
LGTAEDADEKRFSVWVVAGFEVGFAAAGTETNGPADDDSDGHEVSTKVGKGTVAPAHAVETFCIAATAGESSGRTAEWRFAIMDVGAPVVPVAGGVARKLSSLSGVFGLPIGAPIPALTFAFDLTVIRLSIGDLLTEAGAWFPEEPERAET